MEDAILAGLLDDIKEILPQLAGINQKLSSKEDELALYEEFGQIIDRLFGVLGMMNYPELTSFFGVMKETCYKCSRCDNERAYPKVMELMNALVSYLDSFQFCHSDPKELKALSYKIKLDINRAEKILAGPLYSIREGSVKIGSSEMNALVFDKMNKMTSLVNSSKEIIYPSPVFVNAPAGFTKKLEDNNFHVSVIIIDGTVSKNVFLPLVEECHKYRPGIPVALAVKDVKTFDHVDVGSLGVSVSKFPTTFETFKSLLQKINLQDDEVMKLEKEASSDEGKIEYNAEDFIEIGAENIHLCHKNPFDVYVKLNENKLIKISEKDSHLGSDQIDTHHKKGVTSYYVKKDCFDKYLSACKEEVDRVLNDPSLDFGVRKSKTLQLGGEVYSYFEKIGVNKTNIKEAHSYAKKSIDLISKVDLKGNDGAKELLKTFLTDLSTQEHAVSVSMIAGIFLDAIGANNNIKENIIFSAFMHDIGLYDAPAVVKLEEESEMSDEEKQLFYDHPARGAKLLKEMGIKNVLLEAIEQHHMRVGNRGFPKWEQGSVNKLNNIAELIGFSEELSRIIERGTKTEKENPLISIDLNNFSPIIQRAVREVFRL